MKKRVSLTIIISALILGVAICYWIYPRFFSPIYIWQINIPVKGQLFVTSKLITNDGITYWEEKVENHSDYKFGRQIGRTTDGMKIFEISGDSAHNKIILTGFMFPAIAFKKD